MDKPRLILSDGKEIGISGHITTLGRTPDNDVAFAEDSNVSRFHAEIEDRGDGEFWLFDLHSSNGTTLNGEKVAAEKPLADGDTIVLGGSSEVVFVSHPAEEVDESEDQEESDNEAESDSDKEDTKSGDDSGSPSSAIPAQSKKLMFLMVFASIAIGLAVVLTIGAVIYSLTGDSAETDCAASAEIVSPENGDILSETTSVKIEVSENSCVNEAVFVIGGKEFARASASPFEGSLDPDKFPQMSDGRDRKISIVLIDNKGTRIPQNTEIAISLETIEAETPEPTETPNGPSVPGPGQPPKPDIPKRMSLIDTQTMANKILPQFSGGSRQYNTNNQQFLEQVARMTAEYASAGYYARASQYRDVINYQYLREQNLDPPLGYILAMSRSKFQPVNRADGAGLWRMNNQLVLENAYNGICGAETIAHETQKCAAIASSSYLKDLILNVFNGDVIYGVAAFGMDKQEASAWNRSLPADRADFWNVIRDPKRREEVVRFFAAAVVMENPQKFGLQNDKPISTLYPAYAE